MAEWAKISVGLFRDEAVASLTDHQVVAYLRLVLWAQEKETDGHVTPKGLRAAGVTTRQVAPLVAEGLLAVNGNGWNITGFLKHQRSREQLEQEREANRRRAERARESRRNREEQ